MDGIELMVEEHKYIRRMLIILRKASYGILKGQEIDYEDFSKMIDFVRSYADAHHHGKEEKMLFNRMVDEIGGAAEKIVKYGMLVEHDLGRFHIRELEQALKRVKNGDDEAKIDVIASAVGYANLLDRHIEKENSVAYQYAKRALSEETQQKINKECEEFERETETKGIQKKYLNILEELDEKYSLPM